MLMLQQDQHLDILLCINGLQKVCFITNKIFKKNIILEFDKHFIDYLSRPEIDGWEIRKGNAYFFF